MRLSRLKTETASASSRTRTWRSRLLALALGCLVAAVILEVFLRWYDPFSLRVHGNRISLRSGERTLIRNTRNVEGLDAEIVRTRNSLGFRGPEPPDDMNQRLTVIAVGGSTTECAYLSDGKTWPDRLQSRLAESFDKLWVNNAGLDGHSTHGHRILLDSHIAPARPKVVLYLVGINELRNDRGIGFDGQLPTSHVRRMAPDDLLTALAERSAIASLIDNLTRHRRSQQLGLTHGWMLHQQLGADPQQLEPREVSPQARAERIAEHSEQFLPPYRTRLRGLVEATRDHGIEPVLITQPALYGPGVDPARRLDLARLPVRDIDGELAWQVLELYNDVTRQVAAELQAPLIDLARQMPKSTEFFYDHHHFNNRGADRVSQIVARELTPHLRRLEARRVSAERSASRRDVSPTR